MYSEKTIQRAVDAVTDLWWQKAKLPSQLPFKDPVFHTPEECRQFVDNCDIKFKKAVEVWGEKKAPEHLLFDTEELLWIRNERAMCQASYPYYAERYVWILGEEKLLLYSPQLSQKIFNYYRGLLEDKGWAIMIQALKARQVGITTDCQSAVSHRTCFFPDVVALTGSCNKDKTVEMVEKYKLIYETLPYWLKPGVTRDREGSKLAFGELNSRLVIQHGSMETGIGRGNTTPIVHLSELAEYPDPATLIDAGLMPAIHENPRTWLTLESTAARPHDWWYKTWHWNKENYWQGRSELCPMFLPYFTRPDIYPTEGWMKRRAELFATWTPDQKTIAHAERAAKYVRSEPVLQHFYAENWQLPREQMFFWEITRSSHIAKGKLDVFLREFPADDGEAFTASGESVFPIEITSEYFEKIEKRAIPDIYAFRSESAVVPERFHPQPHQVDRTKRSIKVGPYELVPCLFPSWNERSLFDRLLVFEYPDEGGDYSFGVQTGYGLGMDRTTVEGFRDMGAFSGKQICELTSPYINSQDLAPMLHCIGLWYQDAMGKQPKMAIDCTKNGELTQLNLRQLGWGNFHRWLRYDRTKIEPAKASRIGYYINCWSRPMLMDMMTWALRGDLVEINSKVFVEEMQSLHVEDAEEEARATEGSFDNRFLALSIVYFSQNILRFRGATDTSFLSMNKAETGKAAAKLYRPDERQCVAPPFTRHEPPQQETMLIDQGLRLDQNRGEFHSWEDES